MPRDSGDREVCVTTYMFAPTSTVQFVDWSNPAVWAGGVVPNAPDADVVFPVITSQGQPYQFYPVIASGESYLVDTVTMYNQTLSVNGTLRADGAVVLRPGSEIDLAGAMSADTLTIDGIDVQGRGVLTVNGLIDDATQIGGNGLTVNAGALTVDGELTASSGDLQVNVPTGSFSNLNNGVLTGGKYLATSGYGSPVSVLSLSVGGVVTVDAAEIDLDQLGQVQFYNPGTSQYASVQSTLQTIAQGGKLSIGRFQDLTFGALIDAGVIDLDDAIVTTSGLTIASGGVLSGGGTVSGAIVNNGTILVGYGPPSIVSGDGSVQSLKLADAVSGSGTIEISAGVSFDLQFQIAAGAVELGAATSQDVVFAQGAGTLILDAPSSFTGTISAASLSIARSDFTPQMSIVLEGVAFSSVTSYAFANESLVIQTTGGTYSYKFAGGDYQTSDFQLSVGPQALSTDPPSLQITVASQVYAPSISGTQAGQNLSTQPDLPLAGVTVGSVASSDTLNVTVTESSSDAGTLAASPGVALSLASASYDDDIGVYSITGTAAAVTQALDTLIFTPDTARVPQDGERTVGFAIAATDTTSSSPTTTDSTASVNLYGGVTFDGGAAAELLIGTPGNDRLTTSAPQSFVYGNGGLDTVALQGAGETVDLSMPGPHLNWAPGQGLDIVEGFVSGVDHLAVDMNVYGVAPGSYTFASGAAPTSAAPTFYFDASTDYLWFDLDGTGADAANVVAFLPGLSSLSANDLTIAQVAFGSGDVVNQTTGTTTYGEGPSETLWATGINETLAGGAYREQFVAEGSGDTMIAGAGGAFMAGLGGHDALFGGGAGADTFYFASPNAGVDTVANFNDAKGDVFDLQGSSFSAPAGFHFTAGVGFVEGASAAAVAQTATLAYDTSTSYLWFDPDGTGPAARALVAFLPGTPSLRTSDFNVV